MKTRVLLFSTLSLSVLAMPAVTLTAGAVVDRGKECSRQPLTIECLDYYAQKNEENVEKVLSDVTEGRPPELPPPALPGLESLRAIDLGKLAPK